MRIFIFVLALIATFLTVACASKNTGPETTKDIQFSVPTATGAEILNENARCKIVYKINS